MLKSKFSTNDVRVLLLVVCAFLVFNMGPAAAEGYRDQWHPSPLEISKLPDYCKKQFLPNTLEKGRKYIEGCGGHYNHFCPGLVMLNRASDFTKPKAARREILREARVEISYIRGFPLPATCPILPDIAAAEARLRMLESLAK